MVSNVYAQNYTVNYYEERGLDLSNYQSGIDFNLIKDNYSFVILRAGFTGYGNGVSKYKDNSFEKFYEEAKNHNLKVGAYWYSCANSYEKGLEEAKFMYDNALKGKQFEYPIVMDVEENRYQASNRYNTTQAIKGFTEYLESKGYYVSVYANNYYFNNNIDTLSISNIDKWLAFWTKNKPSFKYGNYGIWQNSNSGRVGKYRVDTNVSYKDYAKIMKDNNLNGFKNSSNNNELIANEVIEGKWGNDIKRKEELEKNGYDYNAIQSIVNEKLEKNNIVNEVINEKDNIDNSTSNDVSYTVVSGDTLWKIANDYYKDGNKYNIIVQKNNIKNPNLIYPGQVLIL